METNPSAIDATKSGQSIAHVHDPDAQEDDTHGQRDEEPGARRDEAAQKSAPHQEQDDSDGAQDNIFVSIQ